MLPSLRKEWKGYGRANRLGESTILTTDASTPITLDSVAQHLRNDSVKRALSALDDLLNRRRTDADRWPQFKQFCAAHQLRELLQQDPLTFRAFTKPRGYAGDAVMMDYVYPLFCSLRLIG